MTKRLQRKVEQYSLRKKIYIYTEGSVTEVGYFKQKKQKIHDVIRVKPINIRILGMEQVEKDYLNDDKLIDIKISGTSEGKDNSPLGVVKRALGEINEKDLENMEDSYWVVFDKDHYNNFDEIIKWAKKKKLKVAYSNLKFELWLLLHFEYLNNKIPSKDYEEKLNKYFKELKYENGYQKKLPNNLIEKLEPLEMRAIKYANNLLKKYSEKEKFSAKNPSTTVHELIKELNDLKNERDGAF